MKLTAASDTRISYSDGRVSLIITYDATRSYELSVYLQHEKLGQEHWLALSEVLAMQNSPNARYVSCVMAPASGLDLHLRQLASITRLEAVPFLAGDASSYEKVRKHRDATSNAVARQKALAQAMAKAELAWTAKDFRTFVETLEPLWQLLPASAQKKVLYAQGRI